MNIFLSPFFYQNKTFYTYIRPLTLPLKSNPGARLKHHAEDAEGAEHRGDVSECETTSYKNCEQNQIWDLSHVDNITA